MSGITSAAISREPLLVGRVGEGVDQADAQRLDALVPAALELGAGLRLVELGDDLAVAADPPDHLDGVLQRRERLGLGPDDPAGEAAGHEGPRDLQHLPEPSVVTRPTRAPLPSRIALVATVVPCSTSPMSSRLTPAAAQTRLDAAQHADRLVLGRGGRLGAMGRARRLVDEQDVGERASDVHAEPVSHAVLLR